MSLSPSLKPSRSPSPQLPAQPDHFYGSEDIQLPPSPRSDSKAWLTPQDDPLAHRGIPVFKPTMEEFQDFEEYVTRVEGWGMRSGIVKIIPPKEWTESLPPLREQLNSVKIQRPIEQHMLGRGGLFRQENIEKRKFMSIREWAEMCGKDDFRAPGVAEVGVHGRGAKVATRTRAKRNTRAKNEALQADGGVKHADHELRADGEPMDVEAGHAIDKPIVVAPTDVPPSPASQNADIDVEAPEETADQPKPKRKRVAKRAEERHAEMAAKQALDAEFLTTFEPHDDWLPADTKASDYTREYCQELERKYWRNLGLGKPAWYGADSAGSLFTEETSAWNVANLHSTLSRLLPANNQGLPGVNTPYLYFGMWRATFAWHVEDMDLFSINYIHFGAPKFWYAIPQGRAKALEQTMRSYFPKDTSHCPQFLRHKSFLASPTLLAQSSVRPNYLVQHAGEFVITFPRGYHAGFNLGFNCAESVNFALDSWLDIGRQAKACKCVSDSVRIDVDQLLHDRAADAALAAAQTEEPEPESCETRLLPAASNNHSPTSESRGGTARSRKPSKKRKAQEEAEEPPSKKLKIRFSTVIHQPPTTQNATTSLPKVSLTLKLTPRPTEESFPCCLCVSMSKEGLLRVHEPPVGRKDAQDAAGHPKQWRAHEYCARIVPETWVDEVAQEFSGVKEKVVLGVDGIVKDRWNLKCSVCTKARPKAHGAPIQCTKGKCPKAFHVSCARECLNGVMFEEAREVEKEVVLLGSAATSVPTGTISSSQSLDTPAQQSITAIGDASDDTTTILKVIRKLEVQVLCSQHNPAIAAAKKANKMDKIKSDLLSLPSMARIKIRVSSGVFEVSLIRVIEETCSVEVLWDRGIKREFKWGSVVFGSTDGPVQQKPSEYMPEASQAGLPVQTYASFAASQVPGIPQMADNPYHQQSANHASASKERGVQQHHSIPNGGGVYDYWNYANAYGYPGYYPPGLQYNPYAYNPSRLPYTQPGWPQTIQSVTSNPSGQHQGPAKVEDTASAVVNSSEELKADTKQPQTFDPSISETTESLDLAALASLEPDQLTSLLDANPDIRAMVIAAISKQMPTGVPVSSPS